MTPAATSSSVSIAQTYSASQSQRGRAVTLEFLRYLSPIAHSRVAIHLWDGTPYPDASPRDCTVILRHPGALRAMFATKDGLTLAEAFVQGLFDIEGDPNAIFELGEEMTHAFEGMNVVQKAQLALMLMKLPVPRSTRPAKWRERAHLSGKPHSIERDKAAIAYHYNVPTEFYGTFLDDNLTYSSAIFGDENESLGDAQIRKFESICQQLQLQCGQRLLDVGCGWGGFLLYAAQKYGVRVTGITLSESQADEANRRIKAAGLEGQCRVLLKDYREVEEWESYDAISSIEMFEHVGREMLVTYFTQAYRLLKPGGLFLNQGTTVETDEARRRYPSFIKQYVFPDGEVLPIHVSIRASEDSGFEVLDARSIREHYVKTCAHWVKNLDANHELGREIVGEPTWRIWRLYTAVSGHGFNIGRLNCYQTLMKKA